MGERTFSDTRHFSKGKAKHRTTRKGAADLQTLSQKRPITRESCSAVQCQNNERRQPSFLEGVPINSRSFSWLISPTKIIASARDLVSRLHAIFAAQVERLQQGNPICVTCYILKYSPCRAVRYKLERCGFTRRSGREFNGGCGKTLSRCVLVNVRAFAYSLLEGGTLGNEMG